MNASSLIRNEARQEYMGDGLAKEMYIAGTRCTIPNKELIILGGCVHFRETKKVLLNHLFPSWQLMSN